MSDTSIFDLVDSDPDLDEDFGQVDDVDQLADDSNYDDDPFDLDSYGDKFVQVKIDGSEERVKLKDAVAGYQRQADYTRKTQELAKQKQDLQGVAALKQALEADPAGTVKILAQHYGVDFGRPAVQQPAAARQDPWADDYEPWETPQSRQQPSAEDTRVAQLEARLARYEQSQHQQNVEREIQRLQQQYSDFDPEEVISAAVSMGITDLERAYKSVAYDRLVAAQAVAAQQREAKKAAQVVSSGASATRGREDVGAIRTVADAFAAAKRELGL